MRMMGRLCEFYWAVGMSGRGDGIVLMLGSKCFTSFGGLLMALEGPYKKLTPLRVDYVYMLLKK